MIVYIHKEGTLTEMKIKIVGQPQSLTGSEQDSGREFGVFHLE